MSSFDEILVVNEQGNPVVDGQIGHLLTRGSYTIRGYYKNPSANEESFTEDGYYKSGDLVRRLSTGHLVVEGRDRDQINRGGEKLSAEEIEGILIKHEKVVDAVVVGIPDSYYGERVYAFILSRSTPPNAGELRHFLRNQGVAVFKIPDRFKFVDAFPVTGVGKISRKQIRENLKSSFLDHENSQ